MKKLFKRIIPCLLIVFSVFAIAACNDGTDYKYPSQAPLYTKGGIFAEIGNLKISNEDIYNRLMQSYGVEEIENAIDAGATAITVEIKEEKSKAVTKFSIVSSAESDPFSGHISDESPVGKALIGKKVGEKATVETPVGEKVYKIISIEK